jgi:hypothetical protein
MVSPDPVDDQLRRPAHPDRIPSGEAGHLSWPNSAIRPRFG